jgi:hypothetical protein
MLEHALAYAAKGWRVFPCHTPITDGARTSCSCKAPACGAIGKHPRTRNGFSDATTDTQAIERWWSMWPDSNIGGIPASAGLVAFDLDTDATITSARALGLFAEPTMEVRTGNGSHLYFQSRPFASGATIGGIVVRSGHGYVMLPPSLHASGKRYELIDLPALPLPPLALAEAEKAHSSSGARERVLLAASTSRIAPGDRHASLLALAGSLASSQVQQQIAVQLVQDANIARCDPPKPASEVENIVAFAYGKEQDKNAEIARHLMIAHATPRKVIPLRPIKENPLDQPLPGILEDIAQYALKSASNPVRTYAVAAALGVASVLCARRYTTSTANYSSLYFLVVGKSGTGKEHVRRVTNSILRAVTATDLIGPNEWTSRSAVWSSVLQTPQSLAVIDEFGQFLGAASGGTDGATMKNGVLTVLMELYGRVDDVAITPQFSTLALSDKQRKGMDRKEIERPALSLIGLTTPDEWYDSLKANRISSGFLNRFLVLQPDVARGDDPPRADIEVPHDVVQWGATLLETRGDLDQRQRVTEIPHPRRLLVGPEALTHFLDFKRECNRRADRLDAERLGELPVRAAEQALRLALIAALAENPKAALVEASHVQWGVSVSAYLLDQLIPQIQARMADNPVHARRNKMVTVLREAGDKGVTLREIARLLRSVSKRDREEDIQWVQEAGFAGWADIPQSGVGRPRRALVIMSIPSTEEAA